MAKKKTAPAPKKPGADAGPATLKDLLNPEVLGKLKAQADSLKEEERSRLEAEREQAEAARRAEQKRLDNDFGHLLENSKQDWRNFK
ncbi:DUF3886 domain-containing protein [Paenibacillus spiritus]|uniref:DUF3886 domain-containing protein n=1 Tax=Paenibacillus spiritus TaxID=2496557 RepID=A0A5J5GJQ4_9BACL|nr:YqkE family protein [Paenibacillus spiritus]KAA9008499.1 DUF3886 domain-containing protein [Paenibacillus spiritus]